MKIRFVSRIKSSFKRRDWDPNTISGLGEWELNTAERDPAIVNTDTARGYPHPRLPLAERLKRVQSDLDAFEDSLPDLNGFRA